MPFIKISGLTTATAVSATNQFEINQNSTSRSATVAQVAAFARGTATDTVVLPAGTVSAPGLTFTGDTNTGIYSPAADTIAFTEGGVEAMRLDASGNVGIGVSSPQGRFNVSGGRAFFGPNGETYAIGVGFNQTRVNSGQTYYIGATDAASPSLVFSDAGGSERMRIDASGNVGIGTASPATGLQVSRGASEPVAETGTLLVTGSTTAFRLAMGYSSASNAGWVQSVQNGVNATPLLLNPLGGNVGIGTSTPSQKLVVSGGQITNTVAGASILQTAIDTANSINWQVGSDGANIYVGTQTNHALRLVTNNTERMRIDTSGNVGIGTSSPLGKLKVAVGDNAPAASGNMNTGVVFEAAAASRAINIGVNNTAGYSWINAAFANNSGVADNLAFMTGATERVRIDTSGNVGIGTSSPAWRFTAVGGSTQISPGTSAQEGVRFTRSTGVCTINGINNDNNAYNALSFATGASETMRITTGGEVYIAGTTDQGAYNLQVNGTGVWGAGAYVNGSDARIKDDIAPLASGLDVVAKLKPVQFRYKESWSKDTSLQPGFIAQDLQAALVDQPYVDGVVLQGPEYMSVAYQALIPLLTKAIQELKADNDALKARVAALENK